MTSSEPKTKSSSVTSDDTDRNNRKPPSNFIRHLIEQDLASGKHGGRVQTRFPPEPNGYLHIGHAKSICLNFSLAEDYGGHCNLRFDDTNPAKESQEFVDSIKENISWLGFQWHGEVRYASNYFEPLYQFALELIEAGKAYVCSLSPHQAREHRGTLTEPGIDSPDRDRPVAENRVMFERMRQGEFADGEYSLRAMIDMASPNINMRDPVLYRIRHIEHHQTGNKWCIYPTYDYTHCISDAIENITHSLCTLEFGDHRPLYNWILQSLGLESLRQASDLVDSDIQYVLPEQTEFAKLRINYTMGGKRNLKDMVETGVVQGWDDPRMNTLAGMRRRGYTPESIRNFCEMAGVARNEGVVDISMLEHCIREDLDRKAPRVMCVLNPLKVTLADIEKGQVTQLEMAAHPKNEAMGKRSVPFTREIYIDRNDFEEVPPPGFKRLIPGGEVRLRGAYVVRCNEVLKDEQGKVVELICSVDKDTLGKRPEGRKVKGVIHWVSVSEGLPVSVRLYDRLFDAENPEAKSITDYRDCLNPSSLVELQQCIAEPSVANTATAVGFQFEREGYFCIDQADSMNERLVFNRTITLRDSWGTANK
ncbi:MAG: glutamine--tRNA ligase/YqeY domain fusion protein [Gammaproteobacteria bacterium]|nr:glutamine--tRNA ligase/YqeY domain fusion protein [Gammaproteobacteria bacterium]